MKHKKGLLWMTLGLLLLAAALSLTAYNLFDDRRAGEASQQAVDILEEAVSPEQEKQEAWSGDNPAAPAEEEMPAYVRNPELEMPVKTVDGVDYIGVLTIPALDLELPVISQWSYPGLKIAPCRYSGSVYSNDLIIAGHNYSAHFGGLKYLSEGDAVTFTDVDGNVFSYTVVEQEILSPTDVERMEDGEWDLTLFTCTVGGRSRVTIRCEREQTN